MTCLPMSDHYRVRILLTCPSNHSNTKTNRALKVCKYSKSFIGCWHALKLVILKQTILIYLILYLKCTHIKHKQCSSLEAIGRTSAATPIEGFLNKNKKTKYTAWKKNDCTFNQTKLSSCKTLKVQAIFRKEKIQINVQKRNKIQKFKNLLIQWKSNSKVKFFKKEFSRFKYENKAFKNKN